MIPSVISDGLIEASKVRAALAACGSGIPSVISDGLIEALWDGLAAWLHAGPEIPSVISDGLIEATRLQPQDAAGDTDDSVGNIRRPH